MKRLPGVIVSAILLVIGSLFQLLMAALLGFGVLIRGQELSHGTSTQLVAQTAWLLWTYLAIAVVCVGLAVWGFITSIGLFRMRSWARYSTLIIGGTLVVLGVPGLLMILILAVPAATNVGPDYAQAHQAAQEIVAVGTALVYAGVSGIGIWWLVYFNRRAVRQAFTSALGSPAPPRCIQTAIG